MNKPIAVVSDSYLRAENYLRDNFKLVKFNRALGYYKDETGQIYQVITEWERALGYEFSDYHIVPNLPYTGDMQYLISFIKTRIR